VSIFYSFRLGLRIIPQRPSSLQNTPNDDKVKKIRKKKARQKAIETSSVRANSMTYYLISHRGPEAWG